MTVLLHELGHALAFNGWVDPKTGANDKEVASTYDRWVTYDGANFFFNGPAAKKQWGGPVPLARTNNNYHHVCDKPQGPQAKLKDDLMNGVMFANGRRYHIGPMDLAHPRRLRDPAEGSEGQGELSRAPCCVEERSAGSLHAARRRLGWILPTPLDTILVCRKPESRRGFVPFP